MELFEHQVNALNLLTEHDSFSLFHEMGTGKTLVVLIHLSNLVMAGEITDNILWCAPKSALGAVQRDFEAMRDKLGMSFRADLLEPIMTCLNYEKLSRKGKWQDLAKQTDWQAIVLDEAHCVSSPGSNRTKLLVGTAKTKGIALKPKYRICLTGTPVTNSRIEDLWALLTIMKGGEYYPYKSFEMKYLKTRRMPQGFSIVTGYVNEDEVINDMAAYSQSVRKVECLDLPDMMPDEIIKIPMDTRKSKSLGKSMKQLYADAMENVIDEFDEVFDNALVRTTRLRQIATGHLKNEDEIYQLPCDKVGYAMELIENNPNKTVVFYEYKASFEALTKKLKSNKIPFMFLNGDQKNKDIWREFQKANVEDCRVFMVQYKSGNAGIDLYTASDTIFYEPCQSSTVLDQARCRTHRSGVTRACTYKFLITEDSIEEDIYERLQKHEDFNAKMWEELKRKEYLEEGTRKD